MREVPVDNHRIFVDGPLAIIELHGEVEARHAQAAVEVYKELIAAHGRYFLLLDAADGGKVDPGARRVLVDFGRQHGHLATMSVIGASRVFRTFLILLLNAVRLLAGKTVDVAFFSTRPPGLARLRERMAGQSVSSAQR